MKQLQEFVPYTPHQVNQFWINLIVQQLLIQLVHFLHLEVLEPSHLFICQHCLECFAYLLLVADRYVLVNEVLHFFDFILVPVYVLRYEADLFLDPETLLFE